MITIRGGKSPSLSRRSMSAGKTADSNALGTTSMAGLLAKLEQQRAANPEAFKSQSAGGMSPIPTGMGPNMNMSGNQVSIDTSPLLTGMVPQLEYSQLMYRLYMDIYYYDAVAGSSVDMLSGLPFSEFTLGGLGEADKPYQVFMENIERLNVRTLLSEASVDYLVTGCHVSSLIYNKERKVFVDVIPHAAENCKIDPLPFFSQDPIITVKFAQEVVATITGANGGEGGTKRLKQLEKLIGKEVMDKIAQGELELDPLSTLFIPRRTFSDNMLSSRGTSFFKRILPIYLIEKNLFRGTLIESTRRQRGILHLTLGNGEEWEPTVADLEFLTELFMNADSDPLGAIIATRQGVEVQEIRQGGEFWKITDFMDQVEPYKLRALGISDAFLNGDATYQTVDQSLTVFIEMMRSYREMMTRKIFYNKLFPTISMANGFLINSKGKITIRPEVGNDLDPSDAMFVMNDGSKLLIPTISWAKQLKPEGDQTYMDMLSSLSEKGVPVPLRVLAAAGGLNLEDLLKQQQEDLDYRKKLGAYNDEIKKLMPKDDEGDMSMSSTSSGSAVHQIGGKIGMLDRDFGDASEVVGRTKTGKARVVYNQTGANMKLNMSLAKAMRNADKRGAFKEQTISIKRGSNRDRSPF